MFCDAVIGAGALELDRWRPGRVEFVQVPAQPGDDPRAFGHEIFAVIDQQPDLTFGAVELRDRQVRFTQRIWHTPVVGASKSGSLHVTAAESD
ncbi:hypothetical protein [Nocardia sp. R7R-8]|uniref:hypothetical protein n=1 Tax=Nocardia sp. R7R-8 TaxID=3459304 RepID=UPI00403E0EC8